MSRSSRKEEVGETSQHEGGRAIEDSSDSSLDTDAVDPRLKDMPYIEAFGHRYHASGKIFLPFDKNELERMEIQHKLYRHCLDGALTSTRLPLHTTQILDLGTGTGVWAIEMAARYPQAQITGVDVYPIQRRGGIPPNVKFEIDDVENPWKYPDNTFDFIHARSMAGGVRDWPALFRQVYNKLKPGGLFEMTEIALNIFDFDGKFAEAEMCPEFLQICRDLYKEVDMDFNPSPLVPDWLVEIDFEKVVQRSEILPLGSWAQDEKMKTRQSLVNKITNEDYCTLDNHCGLLFQKGGWTKAEYDARMPPFWQEIYSGEIRPYIRAVFTTARKPREEGPS
ncbi:S-adenosyl-L-methionine-dependent methyltransferase [Daldinia loculata]|uniref:S-adenosyl-L-methionine-dependent methyltransferase n=1 Tax=Daldinia loculata TaxID=103429 RepID=UPI0020C57CAB|nr:S-adenosyl-L-methionine-dependent methyltransferase [Daldinia loculata]KAI1645802.1 S-adenosyl-L-methionine-dependent methyltransferase [Daldinia loculata]